MPCAEVWLGETPFNMSGPTYVEFFQQLENRIAIPIAVTGIGGTLLAGISAALTRLTAVPFIY